MIWFFDKDGEKLRYEITRNREDGRYRVVITRPDGSESVEEVDEPTKLYAVCLDLDSGKVLHNILLFDIPRPQYCIDRNSYASSTPCIAS